MALTAKQRAALPPSAFVYPKTRGYPVPTRSQARAAGISETQRVATARNALSRAGQTNTRGSYQRVAKTVAARTNLPTVTGARGITSRAGYRTRRR